MAVTQSITKKFTPNVKDVSYLSKNFSEFRQNLIDFAKVYYPNTYTDFNEASPGMMFIEMAAYVGDVLSFYIDSQFRENLLLFAQERQNIISIAQAMGYKPRLTAAATVEAKLFQVVPALGSLDGYDPDQRFFLKVLRNSRFSTSTPPIKSFRSIEDVDFGDATGREIVVLTREPSTQVPTSYVVSKPIKLISADVKIASFTFGEPQKFSRVALADPDVINIVSVVDSDGNEWSEVDYLGQDVIIDERDVSARSMAGTLSPQPLTVDSLPPSKIIQFKRKPRRFATRVNTDLRLELWFGSGTNQASDEVITLDSSQIANNKYNQRLANTTLDPSDFLSVDTFGLAPANTTLTVTYTVGGGIESNVASNTIVNVDDVTVANKATDYAPQEQNLFAQSVGSLAILNEEPATGGAGIETIEELRQNALAYFNGQNRVVTDIDYMVRSLSMPAKFGAIAKIFVVRDEQINAVLTQDPSKLEVNNDDDPFNNRTYVLDPIAPNAVNLYVLGYNAQKRLTTLNTLVKKNLAKYLEQYRMLTDEVNIVDAFVINIGVDFNITVYREYNLSDVLARTIDAVKEFFNIDRWQINQPIILNDLRLTIGAVDGVRSVGSVNITNKYRFNDGRDYQEYRYPIEEALVDDIIYPSLDPSIFEIRYPDTDIVGSATQ
jgi:hypothetical protein